MRPRAILTVLVLVLVTAAGGCGDDDAPTDTTSGAPATTKAGGTEATTTTVAPPTTTEVTTTVAATDAGDCSAAGAADLPDQPGLPPPVAGTRAAVAAAAAACDYPGLTGLAAPDFALSTGPSSDPGEALASWEAEGNYPLRAIVELLTAPFGMVEVVDATHYVWPSVATYVSWSEAPVGDREAVRAFIGENAYAFFTDIDAYSGPRVGISATGEWLFYHAGEVPTGDVAACSGSGFPAELRDQEGLPPSVAATRLEIASLARECDFDVLADLTLAAPEFTYSFGSVDDAVGYWAQSEAIGGEPMGHLIGILDLPYTTFDFDGTVYAWPSAVGYDSWSEVPAPEQEAVLTLLGADWEGYFQIEDAYTGPRTAISEDGVWLYYVAGD